MQDVKISWKTKAKQTKHDINKYLYLSLLAVRDTKTRSKLKLIQATQAGRN